MTKSEIRKQLQEGMAVYLSSGKTITKCTQQTSKSVKTNGIKAKEPIAMKDEQVQHLPMALKIRFGLQNKG